MNGKSRENLVPFSLLTRAKLGQRVRSRGAEDDCPGPDCTIWRGGEEGWVLLLFDGSTPLVLTILLPLSFLLFFFFVERKWGEEVRLD